MQHPIDTIRDRLINADLQQSASASMEVVTRLQNYKPEQQIVAACATFLFLCEHYRIAAQDAFTVTKNMINDAPRRQVPEFLAVRDYVRNEL